MRVPIDISEEDLDGDYGTVPGLVITCTRCRHSGSVADRGEILR